MLEQQSARQAGGQVLVDLLARSMTPVESCGENFDMVSARGCVQTVGQAALENRRGQILLRRGCPQTELREIELASGDDLTFSLSDRPPLRGDSAARVTHFSLFDLEGHSKMAWTLARYSSFGANDNVDGTPAS